jgi:hypothetical protein
MWISKFVCPFNFINPAIAWHKTPCICNDFLLEKHYTWCLIRDDLKSTGSAVINVCSCYPLQLLIPLRCIPEFPLLSGLY